MIDRDKFFPDDFDRIYAKYFANIRNSDEVMLDPSYWYKNYSKAAIEYGYGEIKNYRSDYNDNLRKEKPIILETISKWDEATYEYNDITLCSSATSGSLIVLSYLKNVLGLNSILFETPCYFASVKQAQFLNFNVKMLPTYHPNYTIQLPDLKTSHPKIVWITQPRFGLGSDYCIDDLNEILSICNKKDYIVVDEATEQHSPSHLCRYNFKTDSRVIKIRSPFKGLGINGPRLSAIIHGNSRRALLQNILEEIQGAMDVFSIDFSTKILSDDDKYFAMLNSANEQIVETYKKLRKYTVGTNLSLSDINNGYIGSVSLKYNNPNIGYSIKRERLLKHCAIHRMPVILGATLRFAKDTEREHIRLNYFNKVSELKDAINILILFAV
uniref:Aminotransferase class I/classII large domain-containing protein n=1 Tax=Candidatus Kentrum sp. LFY TaxID=2126342 RepID=A0A450UL33_9GAMM|nr:MAG: hypothetical protein BECKLFY1418B_GA0070995_104313 [Candidatus Kentron sp. LFY]